MAVIVYSPALASALGADAGVDEGGFADAREAEEPGCSDVRSS